MIRLIALSFLFSSCATHKMMIIDTSYIEGCETGIYSLSTSLQIPLNPIKVSTACQSLYLETLKVRNPKYKEVEVKNQGLQQI